MALIRRVRVVWTGVAGSPAYTNLYFINGEADAQSYITDVGSFIGDARTFVSSAVTATVQAEVPLIDSVTGDIQGVAVGDEVVLGGTASDEVLPPSLNLLIRWSTDAFNGGRRIAGKTFLPYPTQVYNLNGRPDTTVVAALNGAANEFITLSSNTPCVWSRSTGAVAAITGASTWNQFAVLRSRRD